MCENQSNLPSPVVPQIEAEQSVAVSGSPNLNIHQNIGEKGELVAVMSLIACRDGYISGELEGLGKIESVQLLGVEYYRMSQDLYDALQNWQKMSKVSVEAMASSLGVTKASNRLKADVVVNGKGLSLKTSIGAPAAIVNHTTRDGWIRIAGELGEDISSLDEILDRYWVMRLDDEIAEDTHADAEGTPFHGKQVVLAPYLSYYMWVLPRS